LRGGEYERPLQIQKLNLRGRTQWIACAHRAIPFQMDQGPPPLLLFAAAAWVALVIGASVIYRRASGKPIFPRIPVHARFADRWASGDFASNCLLVAVSDNTLTVVPRFPFNLMFLPQIYSLEHNIPLATIKRIEIMKGLFARSVLIVYGDNDRSLRLRVRDPLALETALRRHG